MTNKAVKKAIFPVAGLGTRFLPVTKASPKEMLPIVDKPLIQYAVEEAVAAGVEELIFVTSSAKRAIEDHFDRNFELEFALKEKNKLKELDMVQKMVPAHVNIAYIRQQEALGLGHAILCAEHLIGDEPFAVLLADDLIYHPQKSCLEQMVDRFHQNGAEGVLAIQTVQPHEVNQYGIVAMDPQGRVQTIVEKPAPDKAPSTAAVVGRYILPGNIFSHIDTTHFGAGKEIQLTDAIAKLLSRQHIVGHVFEGQRYDCGSKLGYVQANIDYALRHEHLGNDFRHWLSQKSFLHA